MMALRNIWIRLFVSHAVIAGLGVGAGVAYATKSSTATQGFLDGFKRRPLLDAANVAYRFGSSEHARATLESLLKLPKTSTQAWGDAMTAELRLAVLDREIAEGAKGSPHLDAARSACRRFRGSDCAPEKLQALATALAQERR
jgi:hypothetical protein